MNSMFSVRYAGLDENGIPTAYNKNGEIVKSADLLTKEDLVYSGTYEPRFNASFTNRLSYKGFDLSFMFIYAGGHVMRDVKAGMLIAQHPIYRTSNADRDLMNYWKSAEDNNNPDINPAFAFQNQAAILQSHILGSACISLLGSLVTDYSQLRFPLFGVYPGTVELVTPDINPPAGEGPRRFGIFSLYRHAKACSQQHGK